MGDLVTGRIAEATGPAYNAPYDDGDGAGKFQFLAEVLRWRAQTQPDNPLYSLIDNRVSFCTYQHQTQRKVKILTICMSTYMCICTRLSLLVLHTGKCFKFY